MEKATENRKVQDGIQKFLADYGLGIQYEKLPAEVIHAAKVRVIDTLGAVIGAFFGEPLQIARSVAASMPQSRGATVLGTRVRTTPDMAAFVNASNAHYIEMQDAYHWPGGSRVHQALNPFGHPSDVVTPILAIGEYLNSSGREYLTAVVLAYEVFCRTVDAFNNKAFDYTNFVCLSTALATGKLFGLNFDQLRHCIAMAVVPNVSLRQYKETHLSMWKEMASGQAGRAGVFAAMLARAGMEGPHLPFEGKAGWCANVAREDYKLEPFGGEGVRFKILDTLIKNRPAGSSSISTSLAAEKLVSQISSIDDIKHIKAEVHYFGEHYKDVTVKQGSGMGDRFWHPNTQSDANHSFPYVIAATLMDQKLEVRSYNPAHLRDPRLHALMQKIDVVGNHEFREAYMSLPQKHCARLTIETIDGRRLVAESGGDEDDLAAPRTDAQIEEKFRTLTEEVLGVRRVDEILKRLWSLDTTRDVAEIPPAFNIG